MKRILGCFIVIVIMTTSLVFAGSVYYVDATNGNDANPGTESLPWRTIQKATNTLVAGDTVIVIGGTYNERVVESTSGSPSNLITYQVKSGDTVQVYGFTLNGDYIKIDGFKCDPPSSSTYPTCTGVYINGDNCQVRNCHIYQAPKSGLRIAGTHTGCTIYNNHFEQCGNAGIVLQGHNHLVEDNEIEDSRATMKGVTSTADGCHMFGSGHTIRGNYIHDITYDPPENDTVHIDGIQFWVDATRGGAFRDSVIERNIFVMTDSQASNRNTGLQMIGVHDVTIRNNIFKVFHAIHPYSGAQDCYNLTIVNNTIIGDLDFPTGRFAGGITLADNTHNVVIKNNIVCDYNGRHIVWQGTCTNIDSDYNCTYNSDGSNPAVTAKGTNDLYKTNPKLVNLVGAYSITGADEHLQSNSPCIGAGVDLSGTVDNDYDGNSRPQGTGYDIGAYEYTGTSPLNANINASPNSGEVPLTVNFTGGATGGVLPYSYSWDFGDGTSSSEQNPTHTYSDAGDYAVYLTVTDNENNQDNNSLTISASASAIPLGASCSASPPSGKAPLTVNFTGSATGGTEPYTYSWDFGDSTSSSEQSPPHIYSQAGDYTVTLTVTDSHTNQDSDSLIISVSTSSIPLVASCAASPASGEVPLTVNFTGNATGGAQPYAYSWDFGDGASSSEQNPSHVYSQAGDYTVYLTATDSEGNQDNDSLMINASDAVLPYLSCSPKNLYFGATTSGTETGDQYVRIINAGSGVLTWNIEDDADWLFCSPSSGTDRGEITVSINASGVSLGLYIATITVSSPEAYNSPQYVSINLRVYESEQESPPLGTLDTPVDGSTVSGSISITGWALDDIEVTRLEIKRNSVPGDLPEIIGLDGLVYIGDAVFVEGARPEVETSYPDYPLNPRAGWGYMLLTNDLPYGGNGSFTIYSFAHDASGHREEIGRKTILCDNINRVKPFGTIDTPEQEEIIGGSDYINFGWALTPLPKTIPKDGSTILVWVDGVQVGHPVYDQYREDIAMLYPKYNNAQGAMGYYYLDTTQYENGMHTIAWSVMDDEGEVDEIGARYFFIDNIKTGSVHDGSFGLRRIYQEDAEGRLRIGIKEFTREYEPRVDGGREIDTESILKIQIEEMEPVRIVLEESAGGNMEYIGWGENKWKALPIGSTLDREKGIFSWIPTPGFIGSYVLHFAVTDGSYMSKSIQVEVNVIPKNYN